MRLSVTVDETLLEQARQASGARTTRELIEKALQELVRRKQLEDLADLAGSGLVEMSGEDLGRWRDDGA